MKKILFVCTGNTCRSPMAEALFNHLAAAEDKLIDKYTAVSAGIWAQEGEPASSYSIQAINDSWSIDIKSHRAKRLTRDDLESSDLILAMTQGHKNHILSDFPDMADRVFTFKEYVDDLTLINDKPLSDIIDPYGGSIDIYRKCAKEINDLISILIGKLKQD